MLSDNNLNVFKDNPKLGFYGFEKAVELSWIILICGKLQDGYSCIGDFSFLNFEAEDITNITEKSVQEIEWFLEKSHIFQLTLLNNGQEFNESQIEDINKYLAALRQNYKDIMYQEDLFLSEDLAAKYTTLFPQNKYIKKKDDSITEMVEGYGKVWQLLGNLANELLDDVGGKKLDKKGEELIGELGRIKECIEQHDETDRRNFLRYKDDRNIYIVITKIISISWEYQENFFQ